MGEKYYNLYYYNGNDSKLNILSEQYGLLFCKKVSMGYNFKENIEYYDTVKRRNVIKIKFNRKNIALKYFYYDIINKDFKEIQVKKYKKYNKLYSNGFFNSNFINADKVINNINNIYRIKKIEKIKKTLM